MKPAIATARSGRYPATLLDGLSPDRRERFFKLVLKTAIVVSQGHPRPLHLFGAQPDPRPPVLAHEPGVLPQPAHLHGRRSPGQRDPLLSTTRWCAWRACCCSAVQRNRHPPRRPVCPVGKSAPDLPAPRRTEPAAQDATAVCAKADRHASFLGTAKVARPPSPNSRTRLATGAWTCPTASRVLERFAAPYVVVTEEGNVAHYSSHVGGYPAACSWSAKSQRVRHDPARGLRHSPADRVALRTAVETRRARRSKQRRGLRPRAGVSGSVTLVVEPLPGYEPDRLVPDRLQGNQVPVERRARFKRPTATPARHGLVAELERENPRPPRSSSSRSVKSTKPHWRSYAAPTRNCIPSMRNCNPANEELETSKEEIQSVNEELHTVNVAALRARSTSWTGRTVTCATCLKARAWSPRSFSTSTWSFAPTPPRSAASTTSSPPTAVGL